MSPHPTVGAVILAAGMSRRFGSPKQLAMIDGQTLLERVLVLAGEARVGARVAVVPVWLSRPAAAHGPDLAWVRNPFPERGISTSLRLGLASLPKHVDAALILLGDQPGVPLSQLEAVLAARGKRPVVVSRAGGVPAPPALIERDHFWLADALSGDIGLRDLLAARPELTWPVEVDAHAADVDTAADLSGPAGALESAP